MAMQFFRSQFLAYTQPFEIEEVTTPVENPATAVDRAFLAARESNEDNAGEMFSYDRQPVVGEWEATVPSDAFVRVFVINEYTTVRALHTSDGRRIAEPTMDSWRPSATFVAAP